MCGACGRTVVSDPILGPVRTQRQHLIVAQTVNDGCRSWAGAPTVAATSEGWLVSGRTGAAHAVSTVEMLWTSVLRGSPGACFPGLPEPAGSLPERTAAAELAWRVLSLGKQLSLDLAAAEEQSVSHKSPPDGRSARGPGTHSGA